MGAVPVREKGMWMKAIGKRRLLAAACCAVALCFGLALAGCASGSGSGSSASASGSASASASASASSASASGATRSFTDSLGRTVEVPATLERIAPSGHTAMQVLLTMAPDKMVGLSQELSAEQIKYLGDKYANLPVFGAAFGSKGDMNKEAVGASGAQIVIDTGEPKDGLAEDLDALQEQLGIPVVHITTTLEGWGAGYRKLGELLGMEERGEELAKYCEDAYAETSKAMAGIPESERVNIAYLLGDAGLNAIAKGSYQGAIVDMCANNVVVVDKASGSGMGNEISLEQIAVWNPQMVVFQAGSIYNTVGSDAAWAGIDAIANKNYYEVPNEPWCWLNNPPTVNQIVGLQWLPRLCYPDKFDTSLKDVTLSYYKTFYNYDLTDAEYEALVAHAVPAK
jgi:iron complex transport system substrate-binding protein